MLNAAQEWHRPVRQDEEGYGHAAQLSVHGRRQETPVCNIQKGFLNAAHAVEASCMEGGEGNPDSEPPECMSH